MILRTSLRGRFCSTYSLRMIDRVAQLSQECDLGGATVSGSSLAFSRTSRLGSSAGIFGLAVSLAVAATELEGHHSRAR